jgi:hypothetical protein
MIERGSVSAGRRYATLRTPISQHPLLAVAQGCTIRRRAYRQLPEFADDVLPILAIVNAGGKFALVQDAELEHHHVSGLRNYYRKYRYRVRNGLRAQQGYLRRRSSLSLSRRVRAWLWLPYSAVLAPPVLHGVIMSVRRRDPLLLYHPVVNTVLLVAVCREIAARGLEMLTQDRHRELR